MKDNSTEQAKVYPRHPQAHPSGGMTLKDEGNVIPQAFKEILGKLGKKIVKGEFQDLLKNPAPAYVHSPLTYLESAANDLSYCSTLLKKAAECHDPIERMKYVIANYISTQHINLIVCQCRAPLNPILGETVQRVLPTGDKFYAEQTSHHPPITNFLLIGAKNEYEFSGFFEYKVWPSGLNSLGGSRIGKQVITFYDGGLLSVKDPIIEIAGMSYGDRIHNYFGQALIKDHINQFEAEIIYNPQQPSGLLSSFSSKLFGQKSLTDTIQINIYQTSQSGVKNVLTSGSGSWLSHLEFDGKAIWKIDDHFDKWAPPSVHGIDEFFLPSDSQHRKDLQALAIKDNSAADKHKNDMEEGQRSDKKLRLNAENNRNKNDQ